MRWFEERKFEWLKVSISIVLLVIGVATTILNEPVNMRLSEYSNIVLFLISSVSMILSLLIIFIEIDKITSSVFKIIKIFFQTSGKIRLFSFA